ncbi:C40 family peptidase [Streptomyces sp. NPDC048604]|uniref:C40 family peptidase n=1 Tax=Streptomyces sp. NPDC048604 TaxID=3365578 RepID=UPI00371C3BA8
MPQVIVRTAAARTRPTPTSLPSAPAHRTAAGAPPRVVSTASRPADAPRRAPAPIPSPPSPPRARRRHGAPARWSAAAPAARLLSPEAASVATAALRVAGVTLLGVLAVLFGVVLAQRALPDAAPADRPGTVLQLPHPKPADGPRADPPPAARPKPATPAKPATPPRPAPVQTVLLRPGDTLWSLAQRHHTTVAALQKANGLGAATTIYAGERLRLTAAARQQPPATTPGTGRADRAVTFARAQVGKPYVWGGTGPAGYDCSGLVQQAWRAAGVSVSRTTYTQLRDGVRTTRARLVPGDLVITNRGHHVLLYAGDGTVIEAPRPGAKVRTAPLPPHAQVVAYRHIAR